MNAQTKERSDVRSSIKPSDMTHFAHPTDLSRTWCGSEREPKPLQWRHQHVGCVVCMDLWRTLGLDGWLRGES